MEKLYNNNKGASLLMVMVLGGIVAASGYLSLNTFKGKIDSAKKEKLTQKSTHYKNILESKLATGNCSEFFPPSVWKSNLILNKSAFQSVEAAQTALDNKLAQLSLANELSLTDNEEIKVLGSEVVPGNNLVDVFISLNKTSGSIDASSRAQKIRLFVNGRNCRTALGSGDNLERYCNSSGGVIDDNGSCIYRTSETQETAPGEYNKENVVRNMDETLCRMKVDSGNILNLNNNIDGPPNCKIDDEQMFYGCKLESGGRFENLAGTQVKTGTRKDDVSRDVNLLRKEAIKSQSVRIATKFQQLKTYVQEIQAQSGGVDYTGFEGVMVDFYSSIYGPIGVFGAVGLNALLGGPAMLGLLGSASLVAAPIVVILVVLNVACTGSKRRIVTNYTCNQGAFDISSMMIQKKKFGCKWLKCGCHWKDEQPIDGVNFNSTLADILNSQSGATYTSLPIEGEEDDSAATYEAAVAAYIQEINAITTLEALYAPVINGNNGVEDPEDQLFESDEVDNAFTVKENELWTIFIAGITAIDASDDNALETLDNIVDTNSVYIDLIDSNSVKNDVNQAISNKRNEINS